MSGTANRTSPILGVLLAEVADNRDPAGLGRVRLKLISEGASTLSAWARVAVPLAGQGWGTYFLPDIGARVLVAFEQGDPACPYVIGQLWSKAVPPPEVPSQAQSENHHKLIQTRSGHRLLFDDTPDAQCIELCDATGKNLLRIRSEPAELILECSGPIQLRAGGSLTLTAQGQDMELSCGRLKIQSESDITMSAAGSISVSGQQSIALSNELCRTELGADALTLSGPTVSINDGALEVS